MSDEQNNHEADRTELANPRENAPQFATEGPIKRVSSTPDAPDELGETELGAKPEDGS